MATLLGWCNLCPPCFQRFIYAFLKLQNAKRKSLKISSKALPLVMFHFVFIHIGTPFKWSKLCLFTGVFVRGERGTCIIIVYNKGEGVGRSVLPPDTLGLQFCSPCSKVFSQFLLKRSMVWMCYTRNTWGNWAKNQECLIRNSCQCSGYWRRLPLCNNLYERWNWYKPHARAKELGTW